MSKLATACMVLLVALFLVFAAYAPRAQGRPQGGHNYDFQYNNGKFYDLLVDSSTNFSFRLAGRNQRMLGLAPSTEITKSYYVISSEKTKNHEDMLREVLAAAQNDRLNLWVQCLPKAQGPNAVVDYLILSPDLPK